MSHSNDDLLLEIGCEELPTNAVRTLKDRLASTLQDQFEMAKLLTPLSKITAFSTPRRIAVSISQVITEQEVQHIERQGPSVHAAYNQAGAPTPAALGFAEACGVDVAQLETKETPKGKFLFFSGQLPGHRTLEILPDLILKALHKMPIDRPMRWGKHKESFARPVHWILLIFGKDPINASFFDLISSNQTYGHRFHHPQSITISSAQSYNEMLRTEGQVLVSFDERRKHIEQKIKEILPKHYQLDWDTQLIDEVTALVEWPVILMGRFNPDFLTIPSEVLITSMKTNQKYFPIFDDKGQLQPVFILVSNIESKDPAAVIHGNERVLNARLSDAAFFYKNDLAHGLENYLPHLEQVIFQKQLGSLAQKTERIVALTVFIAGIIGADLKNSKQAAQLCKGDLLSEMVNEFPTLQGIMGSYYALQAGLDSTCAAAIKEHYFPRFAGDALPNTLEGIAVALADKLDTLVGIFGINQAPTGDKDPFALRRAANGILQILIEKKLDLDLMEMLKNAQQAYPIHLPNIEVIPQVFDFVMNRLKSLCLEKGASVQQFESVLAKHPLKPLDFMRRLEAVQKFQTLPEATALAAADKRVRNILRKQTQEVTHLTIDPNLFEDEAENELARQLTIQNQKVISFYQESKYIQAFELLSTFKEPVDHFFDKVMVMTENAAKRHNRLALLTHLHQLFTCIADISLLV